MPLVTKTFADIITFTRASNATYFDATGTLQTATSGTPRFDYDPSTLAPRGFLIEEQRTNSIRNNTMVGAVAGTPGTVPTNWTFNVVTTTGLTTSVVGTGTESGIAYIDLRINGTASGAGSFDLFLDTSNGAVASNGQTWAASFYLKLQAGSTTGISSPIFYLYEYTSGTVFVSADQMTPAPSLPTGAALNTQRYTGTTTITGGATVAYARPNLKMQIANGAAIDITLRIGLPQLELGAFATSVIPTSTVAVTRNADVASVNTLSPWYNASAGTLYAEALRLTDTPVATYPSYGEFDFGSGNRLGLYSAYQAGVGLNEYRAVCVTSGLGQADIGGLASRVINGTVAKQAFAFTTNDFALSVNGSAVFTDPSGTISSSINRLSIGSSYVIANFANAWIRRITYYPRRLSNAELQTLTT